MRISGIRINKPSFWKAYLFYPQPQPQEPELFIVVLCFVIVLIAGGQNSEMGNFMLWNSLQGALSFASTHSFSGTQYSTAFMRY